MPAQLDTLDPLVFPHIWDAMLRHLDMHNLLTARLTNKAVRGIADSCLAKRARHVHIEPFHNSRAVAYACDFAGIRPADTVVDRSAPLPLVSLAHTRILDDYWYDEEEYYLDFEDIVNSLQELEMLRIMTCDGDSLGLLVKANVLRSATIVLFLSAAVLDTVDYHGVILREAEHVGARCPLLLVRVPGDATHSSAPVISTLFRIYNNIRPERLHFWAEALPPFEDHAIPCHAWTTFKYLPPTPRIIGPLRGRSLAQARRDAERQVQQFGGGVIEDVEEYRKEVGEAAFELYLAPE